MQRTDDPQVKVTIIKVASIALIVAILAWSLPLDSIHSDTFFIGGRWFDTLIWITRGLSVFGGMFTIAVIADKGSNSFNKFLKGREQVINARLKNKKLTQELDLTPKIIGAGLERGFSVEYDKLKVYSPIERMHESYRYDQPKDEPNSLPPETYNLSDALSDYEPSEKGIILGKSSKGLITLPLGDQICHIAEASKTGSGKTQLNRSIAAQLIYAGQHVYFIDPFFREVRMNYSTGQKFDYRPFVPKLAGLGSSVDSCVNILKGAYEEVQRRQSVPTSRVVRMERRYYVLDELPYLASEDKQVMRYINILVRVGRNFLIYLIIAAQDWQNNTFGVDSGSFRGNFITNFFGDGDVATARILLGMKPGHVMPNMDGIGRNGSWMFKADSYSSVPVKIRTPLADNEAVYQLLGRPEVPIDEIPVEEYEPDMEPLPPRVVESDVSASSMSDIDKVRAACTEIERRGDKPSRRKVAMITGFGETKAGDLMKQIV